MLDEAPLICAIPQPLIKGMGLGPVVPARYFDPPTILLPRKCLRRSDEGATRPLPPMTVLHNQRCQARQIPRSVKQRQYMNADDAHHTSRGLDGNENGIRGTASEHCDLAGDKVGRCLVPE